MGILYLDGEGSPSAASLVTREFENVFGGDVSSLVITIKDPKTDEAARYFCIKLNVDEIDGLDTITRLKIARAVDNLKKNEASFTAIQLLEGTADLDYIFSIGEKASQSRSQRSFKDDLDGLKKEINSSPTTTHESSLSNRSESDKLSHSDENDSPSIS